MSLVQGYSSSEEEDQLEQKVNTDQVVIHQALDSKDGIIKVGNATVSKESYDGTMFYINSEKFKRGIEGSSNKLKTKRRKGNLEDSSYQGPWSKFKDSSSEAEDDEKGEVESDSETESPKNNNGSENELEKEEDDGEEDIHKTTEFYGIEELDYQGRTYMHIPPDIKRKQRPEECFVPKRQIRKLSGHLKGITKLEFFPVFNHLLLSAGNDSKIYLWSLTSYELLRGFFGHDKPIRDISFNNDGSQFLSSSYDKTVKLWDTEKGTILGQFKLKSVGNCVRFNPFNNDEFIIGLLNHKIEHYSISKNELLQTYDHHLGSINDLLFLRDSQRFVSTSEDKTIRVWDIGINIPIKLISDPTLHSMPVLQLHPTEKYFIAQSMDNSILTFSTKDRFKTNKKKVFKGHNCAGYGIGMDFSPDGKYVISGDSNGFLVIWEWKTCKLLKKIKVDDKLVNQVRWNINESSKVTVAGISGSIYYYD